MNISTPLVRLPDNQETLNNMKGLPPDEEIPFENDNSEAYIDNTPDEDESFRGSDKDWTRSAIFFLLIIFVFMVFIYWGIQDRPNSKGSSVPQAAMAENMKVNNPLPSEEVMKPKRPVSVEESLGSDHSENRIVRVVIQKNAEKSEDTDKEIKQLSGIMEIIKQTDEVIEYVLSE